MAFREAGNEGNFNGVTEVVLVGPPATGQRRVVPVGGVTIYNKDTAAVTITVSKKKASTLYPIKQHTALATLVNAVNDYRVVLDAVDEQLVAVMSGAPATNQPTFTSAFAETA